MIIRRKNKQNSFVKRSHDAYFRPIKFTHSSFWNLFELFFYCHSFPVPVTALSCLILLMDSSTKLNCCWFNGPQSMLPATLFWLRNPDESKKQINYRSQFNIFIGGKQLRDFISFLWIIHLCLLDELTDRFLLLINLMSFNTRWCYIINLSI